MNSFENPEMLKAAQKGYAAAQKAKIYIKLLEEKVQELKKENEELKNHHCPLRMSNATKMWIEKLYQRIEELKKENKELKIAEGHRFVDRVCSNSEEESKEEREQVSVGVSADW